MNASTSFRASLLFLALLPMLPVTVTAQEMDHSKMQMPMPDQPASTQQPKNQTTQKKKTKPATNESHAGHGTEKPAASPAQEMDHSKMGHDMGTMPKDAPSMPVMDHAGMQHETPTTPAAPTQPRTPIPSVTDADRAAAIAPSHGHDMFDNAIQSYVLINRLEVSDADPGTAFAWEGQGWTGTDLNRLWLRSEGERSDGRTEAADLELLYGRSISTWWDLVAGVRQDFKPGDPQTFAAIGVQGLAPQKFEVEATAYVGERGQTAARFEAEYELLLNNRLILQPLVEVNLFGKNDSARGIGSGLSTAEAGLRLRYEFTRKFAPYIGVVYERAFGNTADQRREELEDVDDTRVVIGLRTWF
jgi:copper resistance protein B